MTPDATSVTTNAPLSEVPAACMSSPSGQSPFPVDMSMPTSRFDSLVFALSYAFELEDEWAGSNSRCNEAVRVTS